jgi:hypothetical protein
MGEAIGAATLKPVAFAALAGWGDDDHAMELAASRRGAGVPARASDQAPQARHRPAGAHGGSMQGLWSSRQYWRSGHHSTNVCFSASASDFAIALLK